MIQYGGTLFSGGANHTAAIAPGGPGYTYSRVFTDLGVAVWFDQHNGSNWTQLRQLGQGAHPTTFHRACVATNTVNYDMLVAWATSTETPVSDGSLNIEGSRPIMFVESHDGGSTWSYPDSIWTGIDVLRTRTGISCAFDLTKSRFVIAYADHEERLGTISRITSLGSSWTFPTQMTGLDAPLLRTSSPPSLSFDSMNWNDDRALLSWWDIDINDQRTMWIRWSAGQNRYIADTGVFLGDVIMTSAEEEQLRGGPIMNVMGGAAHWAFTLQASQVVGRYRRRLVDGWTSAEFYTGYPAPPTTAVADWYVSAAANRYSFTEKAYLRHIIYNQ